MEGLEGATPFIRVCPGRPPRDAPRARAALRDGSAPWSMRSGSSTCSRKPPWARTGRTRRRRTSRRRTIVDAMTGVLPVDKPAGPTSHDVVGAARRALRTRRIGHTGTLDPFATGLLLLCVGSATRLAEYLDRAPQGVRGHGPAGCQPRIHWTDTGAVTVEAPRLAGAGRCVGSAAAFEEQVGRGCRPRRHTPPRRSTGERAYELARRGEAVAPDPVAVTIHSFEVTACEPADVRFPSRARAAPTSGRWPGTLAQALGVGRT